MKQQFTNYRHYQRENEKQEVGQTTPRHNPLQLRNKPAPSANTSNRTILSNNHSNQPSPKPLQKKNYLDSVHDTSAQVKIQLGENPFQLQQPKQDSRQFKNFESLPIATEDENPHLEIKVFPNSTKHRLEQPFTSRQPSPMGGGIQNPYNNQFQFHTTKQFDKAPQTKKDPDILISKLEGKLFPDRSKRIPSNFLSNPDTAEKKQESYYGPKDYQKEQIIHIKLHRTPDNHFYNFIQEYGIIIQDSALYTPASNRSTALGQSDVNYMLSNMPSESFSERGFSSKSRDTGNFDIQIPAIQIQPQISKTKQETGVFSQYFSQLKTKLNQQEKVQASPITNRIKGRYQ